MIVHMYQHTHAKREVAYVEYERNYFLFSKNLQCTRHSKEKPAKALAKILKIMEKITSKNKREKTTKRENTKHTQCEQCK